ncbi:Dihydrolipoamide acetyltransferase component of pyruvate dehydrogenase complex [Sulfidibacter corallicola]|uniref:Dihydrolipoamide acetyltransferase component of pyruvate dehydrogenase complex n=1 Tax=Sulfidibacter corallicola TaxID=2818388 RepID=A0A8A4TUL9_SULCO|nr:dihydrolipoamide acetyltransferase family protein [Sulfidibacter corallicola]QTD53649.1 2-oxo acid dehydrogenase subunit E2 [Sulfidibacter corallicola]
MFEVTMPSLGADMEEGTLIDWLVEVGDSVEKGEAIAEVDTQKSALEIEAWSAGIVRKLLVEPGETVAVGTPIALFSAEDEAAEELPAEQPASTATATASVQADEPPAPEPTVSQTADADAAPTIQTQSQPTGKPGRARVSPAARKLAGERGIDLTGLKGSGPGGAITLADVEQAGEPRASDTPSEMRQAIAATMSRANRDIPHYYLGTQISLQHATIWLESTNATLPMAQRIVMPTLLIKAVALALEKFPEMNGFYVDDGFRQGSGIHVGVAVSLRTGGLVAPAIHDANRLSLERLNQALTDLVARSRGGGLKRAEFADPTITITNLGDQGVDTVFGVIYPPQVALVSFGNIAVRPLVQDGELRALPCVYAGLSADHRVTDGRRGAMFLNKIKSLLQKPEKLARIP